MPNQLENLKTLLHQFGQKVNAERTVVNVNSTACIDTNVPSAPGLYWIETSMPVEALRDALSDLLGKEKRTRKTPPPGTNLIDQRGDELYVVYSGTEEDIRKRLKQHLFNQGNEGTKKLGCVIDRAPFSEYQWRISYTVIDSHELRYAVEAWWRLNVGWPPFCLR